MAEELPSLHIDTDWKKQAQEEKRKMAEAAKAKEPAAIAAPTAPGPAVSTPAAAATDRRRGSRELSPPGLASLIQSLMTQILYYLGDLPSAGGQVMLDVDMAKHQLDTLTILEEKTKNNLTPDEQSLLDAALYETRSRFINVASQMLGP